MTPRNDGRGPSKSRPTQLIGLLLWRGGLLIVGIAILIEASRNILRWVRVPVQIEIGGGLMLAGAALVLLSFILERIEDSRREGNLLD